jgi:hypothetical protein
MTGIIRFQALAFDLVDGHLVEGQRIDCGSPAQAVQTAQGLWKVFGHTGTVAVSHTSYFDRKASNRQLVLGRFGQIPDEYLRENIDE